MFWCNFRAMQRPREKELKVTASLVISCCCAVCIHAQCVCNRLQLLTHSTAHNSFGCYYLLYRGREQLIHETALIVCVLSSSVVNSMHMLLSVQLNGSWQRQPRTIKTSEGWPKIASLPFRDAKDSSVVFFVVGNAQVSLAHT